MKNTRLLRIALSCGVMLTDIWLTAYLAMGLDMPTWTRFPIVATGVLVFWAALWTFAQAMVDN
jgi:hypothetical protein